MFVVAATINLLIGLSVFGALAYGPTFVQGVIGSSATSSGIVMMPMAVSITIAALIGGQLIYHVGRFRWLGVFGVAVTVVGMFLFYRLDAGSSNFTVSLNMIIVGLGVGVIMPLYRTVAQNSSPQRLLGVATSTIQFVFSLGNTIGVAVVGSVVNSKLGGHLAANMPPEVKDNVPEATLKPLENPQTLLDPKRLAGVKEAFLSLGDGGSDLFGSAAGAMRSALAQSITDAFLLAFLVTLVALAISLFQREPARDEASAGVPIPSVALLATDPSAPDGTV